MFPVPLVVRCEDLPEPDPYEHGAVHLIGPLAPGRRFRQFTRLGVEQGEVNSITLLIGSDLTLEKALAWSAQSLPDGRDDAPDTWHYEIHDGTLHVATLRATPRGPVVEFPSSVAR